MIYVLKIVLIMEVFFVVSEGVKKERKVDFGLFLKVIKGGKWGGGVQSLVEISPKKSRFFLLTIL